MTQEERNELREPWEVLREAAEIAEKRGWRPVVTQSMRVLAAELEAAAAPKPPPTLAEAVRAWKELHIDAVQPFARSKEVTDILEALAREEAAAREMRETRSLRIRARGALEAAP